jgi:serine/threonine protein kinase
MPKDTERSGRKKSLIIRKFACISLKYFLLRAPFIFFLFKTISIIIVIHLKALKVIDKRQTSYQMTQNRIKNEIRIHSNLNHRNIVKMLSHFEDIDNHYMCMEICEGGELFSYLKSKTRLELNCCLIKALEENIFH